jgi:kynurenine aminotransferase
MSATTRREDPFKPAKRVAGQKQDVWYASRLVVY